MFLGTMWSHRATGPGVATGAIAAEVQDDKQPRTAMIPNHIHRRGMVVVDPRSELMR